MRILTIKQEKFCQAYVENGNATKAYRLAYSCENMKDSTINRKAFEMIQNGKIRARINKLQSELKKSSDIKKHTVLEELACIAFSNIRDYVEFDGEIVKFKSFEELTDRQARAIESIKQTKQGIELKLHGKGWTIERICKMLGFESSIKTEITGKDGEPFTGNIPIKAWLQLMRKNNESKKETLGE